MDVAGQYPGAELLTKQHATKAEFLRLLRQAELVHFAGHAVANAEYPWLSRLLFASAAGSGSDTLFAHELAGEHLDDLPLVVLAACGTGIGASVRGEGVLSLARPFIAAGARTVIASLWDVSDRDTQVLFRSFHAALQSGAGPVGDAARGATDGPSRR
jgi:CHAT domain-containing protein